MSVTIIIALLLFIIIFYVVLYSLIKMAAKYDKTKDKEQLDFIQHHNKNKS